MAYYGYPADHGPDDYPQDYPTRPVYGQSPPMNQHIQHAANQQGFQRSLSQWQQAYWNPQQQYQPQRFPYNYTTEFQPSSPSYPLYPTAPYYHEVMAPQYYQMLRGPANQHGYPSGGYNGMSRTAPQLQSNQPPRPSFERSQARAFSRYPSSVRGQASSRNGTGWGLSNQQHDKRKAPSKQKDASSSKTSLIENSLGSQVSENWQSSLSQAAQAAENGIQTASDKPRVFALDVECVASGMSCSAKDRSVAQIGLVDDKMNVVLNIYVKQEQPVVSYLTSLTGLTKEVLEERGVTLSEAKEALAKAVPQGSLLASYGIDNDLEWLNLEAKRDRGELIDIKGYYRLEPGTSRIGRRAMGQDHLYMTLVGEVGEQHDAVGDAKKSMHLYHLYRDLQRDVERHKQALERVEKAEKRPAFKQLHPEYEGVCMGFRSKSTGLCKCKEKAQESKAMGKSAGPEKNASIDAPETQHHQRNASHGATDQVESSPIAKSSEAPSLKDEDFAKLHL